MKQVTIYTDGSCRPTNPGSGGYGCVLLFGEYRKELSQGYRKTTNNRMELLAVIRGLSALKEPCEVTVYSDSNYVVRPYAEGWLRKWQMNNWKSGKKPIANPDLWKQFAALARKHKVTLCWVRSHNGNKENERCDELAGLAARGKNLIFDEEYERNSIKEKLEREERHSYEISKRPYAKNFMRP